MADTKLSTYHIDMAKSEIEAKMTLLAAEMRTEQNKIITGQLSNKKLMKEEFENFKFNINDWVRLRIFFFPFITSSLGFIEERKQIQFVTPVGIFIREYYQIRGWNDGSKYAFPAWRLKLDKDRILTAKLLNKETNMDRNEDQTESAGSAMSFGSSSDAAVSMRYAIRNLKDRIYIATGVKEI